ncbi:MAG: hypothetical protein O3A63_04095 [Proteobacteria bacterium]|nr:hypothetical protein [Pseudomonadota bacterium]
MSQFNDHNRGEWLRVPLDPTLSYPMCYDYKVLGWNKDQGAIDFVLRFNALGGHCQRHRHLANTTIMVLEGEQHLFDLMPDGSTEHRVRSAGTYHRGSGPEAFAHMERGGDDGALVYYQCQADDGRLFEFLDDNLQVIAQVTLDNMIDTWQQAQAEGLAA